MVKDRKIGITAQRRALSQVLNAIHQANKPYVVELLIVTFAPKDTISVTYHVDKGGYEETDSEDRLASYHFDSIGVIELHDYPLGRKR